MSTLLPRPPKQVHNRSSWCRHEVPVSGQLHQDTPRKQGEYLAGLSCPGGGASVGVLESIAPSKVPFADTDDVRAARAARAIDSMRGTLQRPDDPIVFPELGQDHCNASSKQRAAAVRSIWPVLLRGAAIRRDPCARQGCQVERLQSRDRQSQPAASTAGSGLENLTQAVGQS